MHRLLLLSDLHALYRFGLVPPRWRMAGGVAADPTAPMQRYMWRAWKEFCGWCPPVEVAVINGDTFHGEDRAGGGYDSLSVDYTDQAKASLEVLDPLRPKVKHWWVLRGTPYHEGKLSESLEWIAESLGAEKWSTNRRSGYVLDGTFHGIRFNFTHHMTRGFLYRGTGADRTALLAAAAESEAKVNRADLIVRSHLHMKFIGEVHGKWVIFTPGWTCVSPWAMKVMEYYRAQKNTDVGAIIVKTEGHGDIGFEQFKKPPFKERVRTLG